jgi:hypothetical protein
MPTPVEMAAQLLIATDLRSPDGLLRLLDIFESDPATRPTHWAESLGLRDPYDRATITAAVLGAGAEGIAPTLKLAHPPFRYEATWFRDGDMQVLHSLQIETRGPIDAGIVSLFVAFVGRFVNSLSLEWGHIDVRFDGQPQATCTKPGGSYDHLGYYMRVGPTALFPRTFFGRRLLELAPNVESIVEGAGLPHQELPNGCLQVDLALDPWSSAPQMLKEAQAAAQAALQPVGLLARPEREWDYLPGAAWRPPVSPHG